MRLKNQIKVKNTTQEWIAGKIGVPLSTFRKWLTRKTYPDIREGIEIAKLLDISAEYLVTGDDTLILSKTVDLSEEERTLMSNYRKLNKADQENILLTVNAWLGKYKIENLSEEERTLMSNYRKLNKADQENILLTVNAWLGKYKIENLSEEERG